MALPADVVSGRLIDRFYGTVSVDDLQLDSGVVSGAAQAVVRERDVVGLDLDCIESPSIACTRDCEIVTPDLCDCVFGQKCCAAQRCCSDSSSAYNEFASVRFFFTPPDCIESDEPHIPPLCSDGTVYENQMTICYEATGYFIRYYKAARNQNPVL